MQGVKADFQKEDYYKKILDNPSSMIKDVISEIKDGGDVEGVALINERDEIIISSFSKKTECEECIPDVLTMMYSYKRPEFHNTTDTFFTQCIFDHNGLKILAKKIMDDLTLLVFLKKRGYISLAMLDIENSTRRIHEILLGNSGQKIQVDGYQN